MQQPAPEAGRSIAKGMPAQRLSDQVGGIPNIVTWNHLSPVEERFLFRGRRQFDWLVDAQWDSQRVLCPYLEYPLGLTVGHVSALDDFVAPPRHRVAGAALCECSTRNWPRTGTVPIGTDVYGTLAQPSLDEVSQKSLTTLHETLPLSNRQPGAAD